MNLNRVHASQKNRFGVRPSKIKNANNRWVINLTNVRVAGTAYRAIKLDKRPSGVTNPDRAAYWLCRCVHCGHEKVISASHFAKGECSKICEQCGESA